MGESMRYFPVFRSATDLEKKGGTFHRHTSVKLWVVQFHSEFSDFDAK